MLGKSPIKWRQRSDMTIAVDWDVKHQFKQTNKQTNKRVLEGADVGVMWSKLQNLKRRATDYT